MAWGNKKQSNMAKVQEPEQKSINIIGSGTKIVGDIISSGDLRIDGSHEGNMDIKGKLVVGASGSIKGIINCKNADISGKIDGKISVAELLNVKNSAKIDGEIYTDKLAIEPGAKFSGTCSMIKNNTVTEKPSKPNVKKEATK